MCQTILPQKLKSLEVNKLSFGDEIQQSLLGSLYSGFFVELIAFQLFM